MNNSNFPLYDNLCLDIPKTKDLTVKQKNDFMKKITHLDDNGFELVYALIRVFQLENNADISTFKLPYDGKFDNSEMKFDLNELPTPLKQMIYKFVLLHTDSMKEETMMAENRTDNI